MRGPYKDRRVRLEIGPQCFIDDNVTIYAHSDAGKVCLGRGVHVYRGTIIEVGQGGSVIIGDHTHIQSGKAKSSTQEAQVFTHTGFPHASGHQFCHFD